MTQPTPTERHNALAVRYSDKAQLEWLAEPVGRGDEQQMRELMQATRLFGKETSNLSSGGMIQRIWDLDYFTTQDAHYKLKLSFSGLVSTNPDSPDASSATFQFKVNKGDRILMTGFDTKTFNPVAGEPETSQITVSNKQPEALLPLQREIEQTKPALERKLIAALGNV